MIPYKPPITDDYDKAHLVLLNSCTVKGPAEAKFRNQVEMARKNNKFVVIAGCVPQGQPKSSYMDGLSMIGVQQIDRVVEVVEETLKGQLGVIVRSCQVSFDFLSKSMTLVEMNDAYLIFRILIKILDNYNCVLFL